MSKFRIAFNFNSAKKKNYLTKDRVTFIKPFKLKYIFRSGFLSNKSLLLSPTTKVLYKIYKLHPQYLNKKNEKHIYINILKKKKNYRTRRLMFNLPMRGQRTHTNANTRRRRHVI